MASELDAMDQVTFRFDSPRAGKARIGHALGGIWQQLLPVFVVLLVLSGAALLVVGVSVGWLVTGLAALPYIIRVWYTHELKELPVKTKKSQQRLMTF